MKRWLLGVVVVIAALIIVLLIVAWEFSFSALPEPGRTETYLATKMKGVFIARASRSGLPAQPRVTQATLKEGDALYGGDCAACHGMTGRTPTETGRWICPRAADLGSPAVQRYSDRELFWIVKNGIRFSGMPAFGKVESDEHIWDIVAHVRSLRGNASH